MLSVFRDWSVIFDCAFLLFLHYTMILLSLNNKLRIVFRVQVLYTIAVSLHRTFESKKCKERNDMIIRTGERIRQLRAKKNVTQEQLAVFLGVTPQAVSRWENGVSHSKSNTIVTL